MQGSDNFAIHFGNDEFLVGIGFDGLKGKVIDLWERRFETFALRTEFIFSQHLDDGGQVSPCGEPELYAYDMRHLPLRL